MSVLDRAQLVWKQMYAYPNQWDPYEALAAVVWPSQEFAEYFPDERVCRECGDAARSNGLCIKHYFQAKREGQPRVKRDPRNLTFAKRARENPYCKGCGGPIAGRTKGCKNCADRARQRGRRAA